jgi:hypothetical protein
VGQCVAGHDDDSPVCATCTSNHVLQRDVCVACPGKDANSAAPGGLVGATIGVLVVLFVGFVLVLKKPALSSADEQRIIDLLKTIDTKTLFNNSASLDIKGFNEALNTLRALLSHVQIRQLFNKIDDDNSGTISHEELWKYINPKQTIEEGITAVQDAKDDASDKQSKMNEVGNYASQLGDASNASNPLGGMFMKSKLLF